MQCIVLNGLARKPAQNVVQVIDAVISAPLDEFHVAHTCGKLAHDFENIGRETLHAGLDREEASTTQTGQLLAGEIRPDLVMNFDVTIGSRQSAFRKASLYIPGP